MAKIHNDFASSDPAAHEKVHVPKVFGSTLWGKTASDKDVSNPWKDLAAETSLGLPMDDPTAAAVV